MEFSYQWTASDEGQEADIQGATDANYTLVADDAGKTVKVRVSFTDHVGYPESLTSAATKGDCEGDCGCAARASEPGGNPVRR